MTIFNQALSNFEQHASNNGGQDDMAFFLRRTWNHVPPALAMEAIDKMLEDAKSSASHSRISMTTEKGSIDLSSEYQQQLFQLLPILQELDKGRAESILRDNAETRAQLAKYPKGMNSLSSTAVYRLTPQQTTIRGLLPQWPDSSLNSKSCSA
jgi:hypothetical protein